MEAQEKLVRCRCQHCSQDVEFSEQQAGLEFACPHCGMETKLYIPSVSLAPYLEPVIPAKEKQNPIFLAGLMVSVAIIVSALAVMVFINKGGKETKINDAPRAADGPKNNTPPAATSHQGVVANLDIAQALRYPPLTEAEKSQARAAMSVLKVKTDKVKDIVWYEFEEPLLQSQAYLYIAYTKPKGASLRLLIEYYGDDWIFMRRFPIRVDDKLFTITPSGKMARDNTADHVWEIYDEPVGSNIEIIEKIITSRSAILRMEGDRDYDMELSALQKIRLAQMILVYRYLGGNFDR